MSAAPFLQRAEHVLVAAYPCFSLHETPALTAALGVFDEGRARLTGIVAFFTDLGRNLAVTQSLTRCSN